MIFSKKFLVIPILLAAAFIFAYFSSDLIRYWTKPSEEKLKTVFAKNRDSFTKLEQLFMDDQTLYFASSSNFRRSDLQGSFSDRDPSEEYRSIFEQTGITSGSRSKELDIAFLSFPTFFHTLDGGDIYERYIEEKGFAFILEPDEKVRNMLGTGRDYRGYNIQTDRR